MSDQVNVVINFGEGRGYKGRQSDGPAACLPFNGFVPAKLKKFRTSMSPSNNQVVTLIMDVAQTGLGGTLYAPIPVTGTVQSGPQQGEPNIHRFYEFLESAGWSNAKIVELSNEGKQVPVGQILDDLIAKDTIVYPNTRVEEYRGKHRSKVQGFCTKEYFDSAMIAGTAQTPVDKSASATVTTQSNGAARAAGVDPLQNVMAR